MKNKRRMSELGITLVALVITIIVLLILAGVTISMVLNNNGILTKAEDASEKWKKASQKEESTLSEMDSAVKEYLEKPIDEISEDIDGLPAKKTAEQLPEYIPIYTIEQLKKIASNVNNYEIKDLQGHTKRIATMSSNAKYALMEDLNFSNESNMKPIKGFTGELEGNGCILTNLNIDTTDDPIDFTNIINNPRDTARPAALFETIVNGTVKNLAITNSSFTANESTAAIVGQGDGCTIENCYVKNSSFNDGNGNGYIGCIAGFLGNSGATINNCKVISPTINQNPLTKGGICYYSNGNIDIENCQVLGKGANFSSGIIVGGKKDITITNCKVQEVECTHGGIIDVAENNNSNLSINNCSVLKLTLTQGGGIMNCSKSNTTIQNCKVQEVAINGSDCAGLLKCLDYSAANSNLIIKNCSVRNMNYNTAGEFAGILKVSYAKTNNLEGCMVEQLQLKNSGSFGGIAHMLHNETHINNCSAKKISNSGNSFGNFAGLINHAASNTTIDNCNVEEINVIGNSICGGLVCTANKCYFNNCKIKNSSLKRYDEANVHSCIGGIIAYLRDGEIKNCSAENNELEGLSYSGGGSNVGGLLGVADSAKIEDCLLERNNITKGMNVGGAVGFLSNGSIESCSSKNNNVDGKGYKAGGIVAAVNIGIVKKCNVYGGSIKNCENAYEGITGGICASGTNVVDSNIENVEIDGTNENELKAKTGGIIGNADLPANVEKLIRNCSVKNTTIKGINNIGGISGSSSANISECTVTDSTILGTGDCVGGIQGDGGGTPTPRIIDRCNVNNTSINGGNYVNAIQGRNSYNIENQTIIEYEGTVTNCKRDGVSVTH